MLGLSSYIEESHGYEVEVTPVYLDGKSDLVGQKYVFAYHIRILNKSGKSAQLVRRHWFISEKEGREWEVEGEGVIGQQPFLEPGNEHRYQSFCVIEKFEGWMRGNYLMETETGEFFKIEIPRFDMKARVN